LTSKTAHGHNRAREKYVAIYCNIYLIVLLLRLFVGIPILLFPCSLFSHPLTLLVPRRLSAQIEWNVVFVVSHCTKEKKEMHARAAK
jgi:hypothetical protein